ncbi:hypothetical protein GDO78_009384 [Eleutherodactylus coqui]|uniref:Uncharacterized protein n=1 Tax=Eleutherodactylus coqui TaxID=57060 RepID=A0A8J6FAX3_ELECQ|nr:hypothetical protein GDO78_009384 [Eleutherodactylus coqui]
MRFLRFYVLLMAKFLLSRLVHSLIRLLLILFLFTAPIWIHCTVRHILSFGGFWGNTVRLLGSVYSCPPFYDTFEYAMFDYLK